MKNFRVAFAVAVIFFLASCHNSNSSTAQEPGPNDYQKMQHSDAHADHSGNSGEAHDAHGDKAAEHTSDTTKMHNEAPKH